MKPSCIVYVVTTRFRIFELFYLYLLSTAQNVWNSLPEAEPTKQLLAWSFSYDRSDETVLITSAISQPIYQPFIRIKTSRTLRLQNNTDKCSK